MEVRADRTAHAMTPRHLSNIVPDIHLMGDSLPPGWHIEIETDDASGGSTLALVRPDGQRVEWHADASPEAPELLRELAQDIIRFGRG